MLKVIFFISLFCNAIAYGQQQANYKFEGRFRPQPVNRACDLLFLTDSTAAFITPGSGLLYSYINYKMAFKDGIYNFRQTMEIHRKKPSYDYATINVLNDSTFLFSFSKTPKSTDTATKGIYTYKKVKFEKLGTQLRLPTYADLIGDWTVWFRGLTDKHYIFLDEKNVRRIINGTTTWLTYKIDFSKQPITLDFYYKNSDRMEQAFLTFYGEKTIQIEFFPDNNRGDHIRFFGENVRLLRSRTTINR
jgi:hypothetical protein